MMCFRIINDWESVYHPSNYITDLHPATQIEIRRNTPSLLQHTLAEGKQYFHCACCNTKTSSFFFCLFVSNKKNTSSCTYSLGGDLCPVRPVGAQQRVVAARLSRRSPARSLPGGKGVGRSATRLRVSAWWTNPGGDSWAERRDISLQRTVHKRMI